MAYLHISANFPEVAPPSQSSPLRFGVQELFSMPPSWGVLRAGGGTLLWLSLKQVGISLQVSRFHLHDSGTLSCLALWEDCGGQPSARRDLSGTTFGGCVGGSFHRVFIRASDMQLALMKSAPLFGV